MLHCDLSQQEQHRRKEIAEHTRQMLLTELPIDSQDETSIMGKYRDYYLQISFSELHPLMVVCLAKALTHPGTAKQCRIANDLNLRSVLGSHTATLMALVPNTQAYISVKNLQTEDSTSCAIWLLQILGYILIPFRK